MEPRTFLFHGASGCGKGTQALLLKEVLEKQDPARKVLHLETGRLLREYVASHNTHLAQSIKNVIDNGGLLPEYIPIWAWTNSLAENYTGTEHLIFDGVARKELEARALAGALEFYGRGSADVIFLALSKEEATKRLLLRGRKDDSEEEIKRRLSWYDTEVKPAMEYFKGNPAFRFHEVNGERSIEAIHEDIVATILN
jgi:adenylate kinase